MKIQEVGLPKVMWTYRTTIKTPIGHTPFALAFGLGAIAQSELIWPTTRVLGYNEDRNKEIHIMEEDYHEQIREEVIRREVQKSNDTLL